MTASPHRVRARQPDYNWLPAEMCLRGGSAHDHAVFHYWLCTWCCLHCFYFLYRKCVHKVKGLNEMTE